MQEAEQRYIQHIQLSWATEESEGSGWLCITPVHKIDSSILYLRTLFNYICIISDHSTVVKV